MMNKANFPKTLLEAVKYFADRDNALNFMVQIHWPEGITCPWCDSSEHSFLATRRIWKCKACRKQFSAKAGTIFEDSPIGLDKWFPAVWMIVNMKNGISSYELGKALGVMQKTAWFMNHRIRLAMKTGTFRKLAGHVEIDETFISVEPFHLFRYLDEQSFRFNTRKATDADRFIQAAMSITGKRLTFDELI